MKKTCVSAAIAVACLALPYAAHADVSLTPYIVNPGFEIPVTSCCAAPQGWFSGGPATGDAGNWNPTSDTHSSLTALSGSQVGYVNNYSGASSYPAPTGLSSSNAPGSPELNYYYLAQTITVPTISLGEVFSLTYGVAVRGDISEPLDYRVQINGNYSLSGCDTCYSITSGSTASFTPGTWHYETVKYTAQQADVANTHLTVYLVNDGAVSGAKTLTQAEFDIPVPEPSGKILMGWQFGAAALFALAWRKKPAYN